MESLSLLRYWRVRGGAAPSSAAAAAAPTVRRTTTTTTIAASVLRHSPDSDTEDDADADGPFFDLEFTVPATTDDDTDDDNTPAVSDTEMMMMDVEKEFKFAVSSPVAANRSDDSLTLSPSDDLFFNGRPRIVPATADPGSKPPPPPPPAAISKLRVLMLRLRRPKPETAADTSAPPSPKQHHKFFTKLEEVPIVSLFIRDSSSRTAAAKPPPPPPPEQEEEARFSKEAVVQKYIGKIKPLYVRVSKRYGERLRMSKAAPAEEAAEGSGQRAIVPALLRKRLGKSRSAPSAVVPAAAAVVSPVGQRRRDDSLVQQEDGIQSAIAHCKRSFNAARGAAGAAAGDGVAGSESPLGRSMSDPGDGSVRGTQF